MVEQALQTLPAAQRVPLVLFHMEGLQYDEIAAKLGVSLGKVKTDIFRARETLRRKLRLKLGDEAIWQVRYERKREFSNWKRRLTAS